MSDHLPECIYAPRNVDSKKGIEWGGQPCICDRLRACEQRVLLSKPNIELSALYGYQAGRADGLDAAREAVAVLRDRPNGLAMKDDALAAIDALRGEQ